MLDARAVRAALDHIVRTDCSIGNKVKARCVAAKESISTLLQAICEELKQLKEAPVITLSSVTYSGLTYIHGYIVKLMSGFGWDVCSILHQTSEKSGPLCTLLQGQDSSELCYQKLVCCHLVAFLAKAVMHLPCTDIWKYCSKSSFSLCLRTRLFCAVQKESTTAMP